MSSPLRIAFAGTPEFSLAALDALAASRHQVVGVWTQPDRPAGRGRKLTPSPVKHRALALGLTVHQPESLKDDAARRTLADVQADVMVVVAYGLILPSKVLALPRFGCLNIHASLLPRWRGAAPIQRALLAGDSESGVCIMQMDKGLDTGDVLLESRTPITEEDTAQTLHDRLAPLGAAALLRALDKLPDVQRSPQDSATATYAEKLTKEEAQLDWRKPAVELAHAVRAYNPWPVAYTQYAGRPLRILRAIPVGTQMVAAGHGSVAAAGREGIDVITGAGLLRILELQPAGGRAQLAADFANGHDLSNARFG
ncbi:MAG TPA: methionyl-tRNA formyltransferase [Gammaproteobacteria bacterium]|jgi:methionyl-tRNA formyltransferase|nr:methionyl-tRNA formyltransferase [Gammaproteobacteria bacterium]